MTRSLDDFLAAATRAARPGLHHPGAALEARLYLATAVRIIRAALRECDESPPTPTALRIRAAMTNARRNR